jgi:hypothetical protein
MEFEMAQILVGISSWADTEHIIFKNKHSDFPVRNALEMKDLLGLT